MAKILKIKTAILLSFFLFLFSAAPAFAAEMSFDSENKEISVGDQIKIGVFLSADKSVNAVEGRIIYPTELLTLKDVQDGDSLINFWIEEPNSQNSPMVFSGITPGGFKGQKGLLFSLIFETKQKTGLADISVSDANVLLNDGRGSPDILSISPFQLDITERTTDREPIVITIKDTEPPEIFQPQIARDESIFDGKRFLVFATQDKKTGIAGYFIRESRQKLDQTKIAGESWTPAQSPYLLKDQELKSYIYVKAVDKAGNERLAALTPRYPLSWFEENLIWVIMVISAAILALIAYFAKKIFPWRAKKIR